MSASGVQFRLIYYTLTSTTKRFRLLWRTIIFEIIYSDLTEKLQLDWIKVSFQIKVNYPTKTRTRTVKTNQKFHFYPQYHCTFPNIPSFDFVLLFSNTRLHTSSFCCRGNESSSFSSSRDLVRIADWYTSDITDDTCRTPTFVEADCGAETINVINKNKCNENK